MLKKLFLFLVLTGASRTLFGMELCLKACKMGDAQTVARLLAEGQVNATEILTPPLVEILDDSTTFLHWATKSPETMQVLLDNGASLDAWDGEGRTPLLFAAFNMHPPAVALLLGSGANPLLTDLNGHNALHEIAQHAGSVVMQEEQVSNACKVITLLKEYGTHLFTENEAMETPIHLAASTKYTPIIISLLSPIYSDSKKVSHQRKSRARLEATLCCLARFKVVPDIKRVICTYLVVDCVHAGVKKLVKQAFIPNVSFWVTYLNETMPRGESVMLVCALETQSSSEKTPLDLATNKEVKILLDPETWK